MSFRLPDPPAGVATYVVAAAALIIAAKLCRPSKLDAIPTVGSSGWPLSSWWAGLTYFTNALDVIQEGYAKHKTAPFKVAELQRWLVLISNPQHVEELRKAPDDTLSFDEAVNEALQTEHTMGPQIHYNPYHIPIVRSQLTRNIGVLYPQVRDEIVTAFDEILDLKGNEWKSVPALTTMQQVVCRASNRVFVGLPLCRDPDWIDLNIRYTLDVVKGSIIVKMFPEFLKPLATRFCTSLDQSSQRGRKLLIPIIEERRKYLNEYGNEWDEKPNDFLTWLMEEAEGPETTPEFLTTRILVVNFAAIHTSSQSFTHLLFHLAANPQYIQPLREEVESIVEKEGWSKASLGKMRKVDSFLKECQRREGLGGLSMTRKVLKDFTFSDGTTLPKGSVVAVATWPIHYDDAFYEDAHAFVPFRFADIREEDGEGVKHHFVSTTTDYLAFGHGRHACPGRFFAASELKTMLAHIVVTYDIKLVDNTTHPKPLYFATAVVPNQTAKVMFRKRIN